MDRCALFVDAGYALRDGAMAVHGTRRRELVSWDHAGLLKLLAALARDRTGLPVLRCYWYEANSDGIRTAEHDALADIPGLKLRLRNPRAGRREGIGADLKHDLMALARNGAISDALIVSGDEDVTEVVAEAQEYGIRVIILNITTDGRWTIPPPLRQECDDLVEISGAHLRPFAELVRGAEAELPDEQYTLASLAGDSGAAGRPRHGMPAALPAPGSVYPEPVTADSRQRAQPYRASQPSQAGQQSRQDKGQYSGRVAGPSASGVPAEAYPDHDYPASQSYADGYRVPPDQAGTAGTMIRNGDRPDGQPGQRDAPDPDVVPRNGSAQNASARHPAAGNDQHQYGAVLGGRPAPAGHSGPESNGLATPANGSAAAESEPDTRRPGYAHAKWYRLGEGAPAASGSPGSARQPGGDQFTPARGEQPAAFAAPVHYPGEHSVTAPAPPQQAAGPAAPGTHPGIAGPAASTPAAAADSQAATAPRPAAVGIRTVPPHRGAGVLVPEAARVAHGEGFSFGETVARDAPALWIDAVLARKPRMPSDLEARLMQGSALPIDSLLHDDIRYALRRGFWDGLESARR